MFDFISAGVLIPIVFVLALILVFVIFANNIQKLWVKVPPQRAAVFFGRKSKDKAGNEIGFHIMTGGGRFRIPMVEEVKFLDLSLISLDINVAMVANKDGVQVNLKGNANVFFKNDEISLQNAVRKFLDKPREEVCSIIHKSLEGHLRGIAGQMTIEEIISDRVKFSQKVKSEAAEDLAKFGLEIDFVTISEITDNEGYIQVLGKKRTAEVQKDAAIGKAEADRDAQIGQAAATRAATIEATTAQQEAATKKAENEAKIAEAEKERDVKRATYEAERARQQAIAEQAGPLAKAEKEKDVIAAQKEIERVKTEKETQIAVAEAEKREKQLVAEVVKPAEAAKQAQIIKADADLQAEIKRAEAKKRQLELEAEGEAAKILAIGKAKAQAIQLEKEAEAAGVAALADSYKKMDEVGRTIQMIEKIGEVGPELVKSFSTVVEAAAKPLSNVDKITITDFGGNGNAISGLTKVGPQVIAQLVEGFKGVGIDPSELLQKFKLNPEGALQDKTIQDVIAKSGMSPDALSQLAKAFTGADVPPQEPRATMLNNASVKSEILDEVPKNLKK